MFANNRLTDEFTQATLWTRMFVDDIIICGESRQQKEKNLEFINDYPDVVIEDITMVGVTIENVSNTGRWRKMICSSSLGREQQKDEKEVLNHL